MKPWSSTWPEKARSRIGPAAPGDGLLRFGVRFVSEGGCEGVAGAS